MVTVLLFLHLEIWIAPDITLSRFCRLIY